MGSLGGWEWVILVVIALLLFGGSRLAGVGRGAGKAIREFKEETAALRSSTSPTSSTEAPATPVTPEPEPEPDTETDSRS